MYVQINSMVFHSQALEVLLFFIGTTFWANNTSWVANRFFTTRPDRFFSMSVCFSVFAGMVPTNIITYLAAV